MNGYYNDLEQHPIGSFRLDVDPMQFIGALIAQLRLPVLGVQEGGYRVPSLGACALALFTGLGLAA